MEQSIEIDKLTNCLELRATGREVATELRAYVPDNRELSDWFFNWEREFDAGYDIAALYAVGDERIQGLVATKLRPADQAVYVKLAETAPFNYGSEGEYIGVGAHLFAYACKLAQSAGYDLVFFDAKTNLIQYYAQKLGAKILFGQRMIIEEPQFSELIETYFKE